jgi:LPXTG-motif cell wall-anchored protein
VNRGRRIGRLAGTTVGALALTLAVPGLAAATPDDHGTTGKVTLCHATNSVSNPYTMITVDPASIVKGKGHGGHDGPVFVAGETQKGDDWGDIIPPFDHTYRKGGQTHRDHYPGMNWTAEGRAIFDAGCTVPSAPTSSEGSGTAERGTASTPRTAPSQTRSEAPTPSTPSTPADEPATTTPAPTGTDGEVAAGVGGAEDGTSPEPSEAEAEVEVEEFGIGGGSPLDDVAVRALLAGAGIDTSVEVLGTADTRAAGGEVLADGERLQVEPASVEQPLGDEDVRASGLLARTGADLPVLLALGLLTLLAGAAALVVSRRRSQA